MQDNVPQINVPEFQDNLQQEKSGWEDAPKEPKICRHPSHQPPSHLVIPQGKIYRHVCPGCGEVHRMQSQQFTC